jgi:molybdate transport system substrate-binding protein
MSEPLILGVISSMATKKLLADLGARYESAHPGVRVQVESVGGVDAARRVQAGEALDAVVLARDAIDKLAATGAALADSRVDIVRSGVTVAVREGAPQPAIDSEEAVKQAVLAARSIGYSTGPSGVALARLFERWGIAEAVAARIVTAKPGVPVGSLIAKGEVELGFQQRSELLGLPGIAILGDLPAVIQITTTFTGAVSATSRQAEAVRVYLAFMAGADMAAIKRANGMDPA